MTSETDCYIISWYGRADLPENEYCTRKNAGNGWWRYQKTVPIQPLNEIVFPYDPTMRIMRVENPNGRLP